MRAMGMQSMWSRAAGIAGLGALAFTIGCGGTQNAAGVRAQGLTAGQAGAPVVVSCEPHQRTLVRQTIVNGEAVSQVQCVAADGQQALAAAQYAQQGYLQPAAYTQPVYSAQPVYSDVGDARIVRTSAPARVARPVRTRQVVYEDPVRRGRSVKKSAIIIGSSAGVGAGVGAAVGGKKGALIGAAIGGGSAAIWDQITRR